HLAATRPFRLHEDRVHEHVGFDTGGERLEVLRGADLAACDDARVVRHVLRLERDDADATAEEEARERGRHEALARPTRDALHHERRHQLRLRLRTGTTAMGPWPSPITRTSAR